MVPTTLRRSLRAGLMFVLMAVPAAAQPVVELPARDRPLTDRPTDVFTIGTIEGADWEMLSGVRSVAFDRGDNLYILDGQNVRVLVFDANGRYVRQFGSRGGGPGEFQAPLSMTMLPNDELVINDIGNRAFIMFNTAGEFLRNVPYDGELGLPLGPVFAHPLGVAARSNPMPRAGAANASIFVQPLRSDAPPVTLFETPMPERTETATTTPDGGRMMIRLDPVFAPRQTFGVLPDGVLATNYETEYRVHMVDRMGEPLRTVTRAVEPRRVTRKDQEEYQERVARGEGPTGTAVTVMATGGGGSPGGGTVSIGGGRPGAGGGGAPSPEALRLSVENRPFAEFMSVVTRVNADQLGRVWIQRRDSDAGERGPIDLVRADGRYIGTLPAQPMPDAISATDRAAYIVRDELGVERVAVRRLPASWR